MEILFWILVFTWMVQRGATDTLYAFRGKPNPRYELKKAKALAAGQPVPAQPRYGTRDWFADLYSDALVAHTAKRRGKAAAKVLPVDDMLDVAKVRPADDRAGDRDQADEPAAVVHDDDHPYCVTPCGPNCVRPKVANAWWRCPHCGETKDGFADAAAAKADGAAHVCPKKPDTPTAPATPPAAPTAPQPLATVINLFRNTKEITMPNINGEVTGLDPAISYSKALAQFAGEHGAAGNEGYIGFLTKSKVTGQAMQSAHDMQEAFANAQAAADRHAKVLADQKTVQEQYMANPDAGDKDMMLNGQ